MNKETEIQHCQNILSNIEAVKGGLACMMPEVIPDDFQLDDLFIDCDPWSYEERAEGIKDSHLKLELENAHNKYVAVLAEMQKRKS
jgi:hypothetical protein